MVFIEILNITITWFFIVCGLKFLNRSIGKVFLFWVLMLATGLVYKFLIYKLANGETTLGYRLGFYLGQSFKEFVLKND